VGIVGVGAISGQYLSTFARLEAVRPGAVRLVAVADLDVTRAAAVAAEQDVRALTVDELTTDPEVDLVLNLTIPAAHAEIALKAIAAGRQGCGWAVRPTRCSAPACRRRVRPSTAVRSASRSRRPRR
jgi:predicted dehydrogenase